MIIPIKFLLFSIPKRLDALLKLLAKKSREKKKVTVAEALHHGKFEAIVYREQYAF